MMGASQCVNREFDIQVYDGDLSRAFEFSILAEAALSVYVSLAACQIIFVVL